MYNSTAKSAQRLKRQTIADIFVRSQSGDNAPTYLSYQVLFIYFAAIHAS